MCIFADLGEKYAKMWNAQKWHFSRRSAVMKIIKFFDFLESLLKWWKSPPVDHRTLEMCIFADLGEKYVKMWNAQKWQFVAGQRSWKSSNFSIFWKAFKNDENHHQLTTGPFQCAYLLIWVRNMQKCEMPKNDNLSQVRGHENLQIFRLSGKPLKMIKTTTSWQQDPWNMHICWFGWEICKNVKCPKMTFFSQVRGHENLSNFSIFWKAFKNDENHHQLTTGPLQCAYLLICVRKMQKCEMPKNDIFLAGPQSWKSSNFSTFWKAV